MTKLHYLIVFIGIVMLSLAPAPTLRAEVMITHEFQLGDPQELRLPKIRRILPDNESNRYWIIGSLEGIYLLTESPLGSWSLDLIPNDDVYDAAGPTSNGLIYCTADTGPPQYESYISVFDTNQSAFVDAIDLPWDYPTGPIALSEDGDTLYITAGTNQEHATSDRPVPVDSGLLIEIDIASESVVRTVSIQPWAHSIFVWNDQMILVSCDFWQYIWDPTDDMEEQKSVVDIVSLDSFTRTSEIYCGAALHRDTNDFIAWDESHVALLNEWLYGDFEDPQFGYGIWLINPLTGAVDGTVRVNDVYGFSRGVRHACISRERENTLYVTPGTINQVEPTFDYSILVTDLDGNYIDRGPLPEDFKPEYIVETDDCKLVVTGTQYLESDVYTDVDKVFILEWPNQPPVCSLFICTLMPYRGPSPADIEFNATESYDLDPCDELTFEWDFDGDHVFGEPVDDFYTGPPDNPTHSYTSDYIGLVTLKLTDNHAAESYCSVTVEVDIL